MTPTSPMRCIARWDGHAEPALDLLEALDRRARETPDVAAIVQADGRTTFAALASASRSLARRLAGDRSPAIFLGPAGPDYLAAEFACLRSGRPFLPVADDGSPLRLTQVALASGAGVAIRSGESTRAVGTLAAVGIPTISASGAERAPPPRLPAAGNANDAAVLVFTSGSTGVSKGVAHAMPALISSVVEEARLLDVRAGDRPALVTPASVVGAPIFGLLPVATGCSILLAPDTLPAARLLDLMARERATHLLCYVGLARAIARDAGAAFAGLRAIHVYGDRITAADCALLREALPAGARIHLLFGMTEANMIFDGVAPQRGEEDRLPPLGRAIPGMEVWLRADEGSAGDIGELCVGGSRVATGYWRDAAATRARRIPHPDDPARTLFATGDLVRLRPDGELDHVGRLDNQVKLRGWRIELEEIETAARRVPGVTGAAVAPRRRASGIVDSLALLVVGTVAPETVLAALRETLPEVMVPTSAHTADALPLTATGKVDRVRLAEIDRQMQETRSPPAAVDLTWPDPVSERIAALVAREAGVDAIAPDERASDVIVDSLQAVMIALRIEKQFAVTVEPELLMSDRTMAAIVAGIATAAREPRA